jgi:hypothetical protein
MTDQRHYAHLHPSVVAQVNCAEGDTAPVRRRIRSSARSSSPISRLLDAARPKPALGYLEAAPFAEQHVRGRHPDIVEEDLGTAVRGPIIAEDRQHALEDGTRMRQRHQDHRLPALAVRVVGVRLRITIRTLQRGSGTPLQCAAADAPASH